jgi:DNA-binding IclR family transcriptional regulator
MSKERRGIQSIEVGGQLLRALAKSNAPMMLKDLASRPRCRPLRRILSGQLCEARPDRTGSDDRPLTLGLWPGAEACRSQRLDPVRIASPEITTLADRIAQSTALAVWGNRGPTIIRFEQSTHPIHVNMRTGTVMSLLNSATGLVFAAFLPPKLTETLIKTELEQTAATNQSKRPSWKGIEAVLRRCAHTVSREPSQPIPGINAFSAPVFDRTHNIVLAITALGPVRDVQFRLARPIAQAVRRRRLQFRRASVIDLKARQTLEFSGIAR